MNLSIVHADRLIVESSPTERIIMQPFTHLAARIRENWYVLTLWAVLLGSLLVIARLLD